MQLTLKESSLVGLAAWLFHRSRRVFNFAGGTVIPQARYGSNKTTKV